MQGNLQFIIALKALKTPVSKAACEQIVSDHSGHEQNRAAGARAAPKEGKDESSSRKRALAAASHTGEHRPDCWELKCCSFAVKGKDAGERIQQGVLACPPLAF